MYEQAPVGIGLVDSRTGRFLQINPQYEAIIGRSEAEMQQLNFQRITHPDDLQPDLDQMDALFSGRIRMFRMEKRLIRGDGALIWVSLTVVPMWEPGEAPSFHMAIIDDITRRKSAEVELRTKESQLRGVLDNTPAVVYLKDLQGRYLLVNRQHELLFPKEGESVIGKTDLEWFPEENARSYMASDAEVLKSQEPRNSEETAPHVNGAHTYRSVKFPVFDEEGTMIAIGGISTDITDLKQAHDDLKFKEALLRNLIEIQENEKQFLCHEFHDGLIQYAVGAKMSLEGYRRKPIDVAAVDTAIDNLRKGVEDGRRVIRGIRPAVLDDSDVEAALQDLVDQHADSELHVHFRCDPEIGKLPDSVQTTVYRVVQEALNNARKYSGTDVVRIDLAQVDDEVRLEIRDFGCGFDVDAGRKKGFGLTGMTERVRLLGGDLTIESEIEQGTRISARIPLPHKPVEHDKSSVAE
jgi:PAS domain S-box-containing protein